MVYGQLWKVHGIGYETKRNWSVPQAICLLLQGHVQDLPAQLEKMSELCHLPGFRHDSKLIEETGKSSYGSLSPLRWHIWCRKEPKERQRELQEKKKRFSLSRVRSVLLTHFFCLMLIRPSSSKGPSISYLLTTSTNPLFLRAVALHLNSS